MSDGEQESEQHTSTTEALISKQKPVPKKKGFAPKGKAVQMSEAEREKQNLILAKQRHPFLCALFDDKCNIKFKNKKYDEKRNNDPSRKTPHLHKNLK